MTLPGAAPEPDQVRRPTRGPWGRIALGLGLVFVALLLRCFFSLWIDNFDVQAFASFHQVLQHGGNLYKDAPLYDYAPLWGYVLWVVGSLHAALGLQTLSNFHLLLCFFLAWVDVGLAGLLAWRYGFWVGALLLLHPVSFLLTGLHSQFDSVAVLFGLWSFLVLTRRENPAPREVWLAASLLGVSLAFKHFLFLLPVWYFLAYGKGRTRESWVLLTVPYALFLGSFGLMAHDLSAWEGVYRNVLAYTNHDPGWTAVPAMWWASSGGALGEGVWVTFERLVVMGGMLYLGFRASRMDRRDLFPFYVISLIAFTPEIAIQYLAIPLVACAIYWKRPETWAYALAACLALGFSPIHLNLFSGWLGGEAPAWVLCRYAKWLSQLCLVVFVLRTLRENRTANLKP